MKKTWILAAVALANPIFPVPVYAGETHAADQVIASYERMLADETGVLPASPLSDGVDADPLRRVVNAVLWQQQPGTCAARGRYLDEQRGRS